MSFKYINPGIAGNAFNMNTRGIQKDIKRNPINEYIITNSGYYTVPSTTKTLYVSFGAELEGYYHAAIRLATKTSDIFKASVNDSEVIYEITEPSRKETVAIGNERYKYHHWCFKFVSDATNGEIVVWRDGKEHYRYTGAFNAGADFNGTNVCLDYYDGGACSNIIISDTEVKPNEEVVLLPVKETKTNATKNTDGTYTFDKNGQYLKQSIDSTKLNDDVTTITGMGVIINPAYRIGDGITISHFKEKDGNLVSGMEEDCLTSLTDDSKLVSWEESLKKEDLANIRIGWVS